MLFSVLIYMMQAFQAPTEKTPRSPIQDGREIADDTAAFDPEKLPVKRYELLNYNGYRFDRPE